ncbi:MAG: cytochrome c [Armatimonadetes bacterium]|nr:cytochrome c [Armatimonadota bacterium]
MASFALLSLLEPLAAQANPAADTFRQSCFSCHTIGGGRLTGPDLKGVGQRKDRAWLERFIATPQAVIDSGDAYATQLVQDARGVVMPTLPLTREQIAGLLDLIEAESALPKSQFAGLQIPEAPFTAADVARGRARFSGETKLKNGGPPCLSCHTMTGLGGLGGGRLGPDLTKVYERIPGRKALAAWLQSPATPTMQGLFKNRPLDSAEILPLVALFEAAAQRPGRSDQVATLIFFLLGLGGAVGMLLAFDGIWRRRFRSVRRALLAGGRNRGVR